MGDINEKRQHLIGELSESTGKLQERESFLRFFVEQIPAVLWTLDKELRITSSTGAGLAAIGLKEAQVVGMSLFDYFQTDDPEFMPIAAHRRALNEESVTYELEWIGRTFQSYVEPLRSQDGTVIGCIGIALDITGHKKAEEALKESEHRYRALFENMLDGFAYCKMLFDDQGRPVDFVYLDVNASFERLTGLKNVVGKQVTEVIPGIKELSPELFDIYGRVALTGRPERFEIDFKPLTMYLSISVYSTEKGYFVAVFDNITARKKAEENLLEQLDELRRFHRVTIDREIRMHEVMEENVRLRKELEKVSSL